MSCSHVRNPHIVPSQRKFREVDQEESYFDADDDEPNTVVPPGVDEVAAQEAENELHRTPRMFSLAQAPHLSNGALRIDERDTGETHGDPIDPNTKADGQDRKEVSAEG